MKYRVFTDISVMAHCHKWKLSELQVVEHAVENRKMPKEISKLLPHISLTSIQSRIAKRKASKRPKLDSGPPQKREIYR